MYTDLIPRKKAVYEGNYVQNATVAIALNNVMYRLTTDANGRVRQSINVLPVGTYSVKAAFYGNDGYEKSNQAAARIIVNKANAIINATSLTTTYNSGDNLVATLTGLNGKPISNARLVFKVNGKQSIVVTDSNGQANFSTAGLAPNKYSVVIGYPGNSAYDVVYYTTSLEIKKATPKIIAFNKTFAVKDTKTYPIALKDDKDVKIYSGSLTLKIYGKTYTLTVTRGIASFNVPISRIGTYNAVITYAGNSYYEAVSLNTKITITN